METPVIYYDSITIGETTVNLDPNSVIVFVGPNNVGKTTAILEIENEVNQQNLLRNGAPNKVVKGLSAVYLADENEAAVLSWMRNFEDERPVTGNPNPDVRNMRNWQSTLAIIPDSMLYSLKRGNSRDQLSPFLSTRGNNAEFEGSSPDYFEDYQSSGNKQFENLYNDESIEQKLSDLAKDVFGVGLTLSRSGRKSILLYGRDLGLSEPPKTDKEREKLIIAPRVSGQGQGVVSLINLAMSLTLGFEPLVFLDEPEAHLHPPQAKKAGKYISERAKKSQVFITTHSVDLILGLLDSPGTNITLIRLDRKGSATIPAVLKGDDLINAWRNPVVKYSRALSGLMHKGVVLCESDGDCLYYQAALEYVRTNEGLPSHDLVFIPSGGKQGLKSLLPALKKLAVPVCVIADFDIMRNRTELSDLLKSLSASSVLSETDWNQVNGTLVGRLDPRTIRAVMQDIENVFSNKEGSERYDRSLSKQLGKILRTQDGWTSAKDIGTNSLKGEPLSSANRIIEVSKRLGLAIVPFGQLESFHPEAPAVHGSKWVDYVMKEELFKQLSGEKLTFVRDIPANTH